MLRCCDSFGTEGREPLTVSEFRHAISDQAHRHDQDLFGKFKEAPAEVPTVLGRPAPGERATPGRVNALAQANVVEVGGGEFVRREESVEWTPLLDGRDIAQEMVVDDDLTHVVAGTVSMAKPRSITSTGHWTTCRSFPARSRRDLGTVGCRLFTVNCLRRRDSSGLDRQAKATPIVGIRSLS